MLTDSQSRARASVITEVKDIDEMRRAAGQLLAQLQSDRAWMRRRLADAGKTDPVELVSGRSALDQAIVTTRDIIRRLGELDAPQDTARHEAAAEVRPGPLVRRPVSIGP
jgi:hypothetical protein